MDEDPSSSRHWIMFLAIVFGAAIVITFFPTKTVSYQGPSTVTWEPITVPEEEIVEDIKEKPKYSEETQATLNAIAYCESGDRHYNEDGTVLRGRIVPDDIGRYQVNEYYWGERAKELGIDIYTENGNEEMAYNILKNEQGIAAWSASRSCLEQFNIFIR